MEANKTGIYLNEFKSFNNMVSEFEGSYPELKDEDIPEKYLDIEVLLASYGAEGYEGDAFVLFKKGDKLYEVNGSHCSCYGLEDQWEPEETSIVALQRRLHDGELGEDKYSGNIFKDDLKRVLDTYEDSDER